MGQIKCLVNKTLSIRIDMNCINDIKSNLESVIYHTMTYFI